VPTPALYYAVSQTGPDGGLQVTGSHNPPEFNGFKMTRGATPVFGAQIQQMRETIEKGAFMDAPGGPPPTIPCFLNTRACSRSAARVRKACAS
jgi:phosphomannomutase